MPITTIILLLPAAGLPPSHSSLTPLEILPDKTDQNNAHIVLVTSLSTKRPDLALAAGWIGAEAIIICQTSYAHVLVSSSGEAKRHYKNRRERGERAGRECMCEKMRAVARVW